MLSLLLGGYFYTFVIEPIVIEPIVIEPTLFNTTNDGLY